MYQPNFNHYLNRYRRCWNCNCRPYLGLRPSDSDGFDLLRYAAVKAIGGIAPPREWGGASPLFAKCIKNV